MNRFRYIFVITALFTSYATYSSAEPATPHNIEDVANPSSEKPAPVDRALLSEAFGHMLGTQLTSLQLEWNEDRLIKGIINGLAGKQAPMSEKECLQAISAEKNKIHQKEAKKNLAAANEFMTQNAKKKGIIEIEKDSENGVSLLQYQVKKSGKGPAVEGTFSPLIHYRGTFMDGKVFGETKDSQRINLNEAIPGFKQGLIGMQEGEERTLFIHPTLGYKEEGFLPPNSLLIFDVKLIKADAPANDEPSPGAVASEQIQSEKKEIAAAEGEVASKNVQ